MKDQIKNAVTEILNGNVIVMPTETVYGLAADASNKSAVLKIYEIKNRPYDNPLIIHTDSISNAMKIGFFNLSAKKIAEKFWPGPVTIIVPYRHDLNIISNVAISNLKTIGIRIPDNKKAISIIKQSKKYIAAPSANMFQKISCTNETDITESFLKNTDRDIFFVRDLNCKYGVESTIIDCTKDTPKILRPGVITDDDINQCLNITLDNNGRDLKTKIAPGMYNKHYSPKKDLIINYEGKKIDDTFVIGFGKEGEEQKYDLNLSDSYDLKQAAKNLFHFMHIADNSFKKKIAITKIPNTGIGIAINDRLKKAASK